MFYVDEDNTIEREELMVGKREILGLTALKDEIAWGLK